MKEKDIIIMIKFMYHAQLYGTFDLLLDLLHYTNPPSSQDINQSYLY